MPWLAGAIASGGVLGPLLLMYGLLQAPASGASLLLNLEGVFTTLIAWTIFREHVPFRIVVGMLAIVASGAVLSWEGHVAWGSIWGPLAVAGAGLCWAVDNNLTQRVSAGDPVQIAQIKGLVAGGCEYGTRPLVRRSVDCTVFGSGRPAGGIAGLWSEPGVLRPGPAGPGHGANRGLFLARPVHRSHARFASLSGTADSIVSGGGSTYGACLWLHLSERHEHSHEHELLEHDHAHMHDEHHQHGTR